MSINPRDRLAEIAKRIRGQAAISTRPGQLDALEHIANDLAALELDLTGWLPPPRVITTEIELDALPVGAIAFDQEEPPNAHSKRESGDWYAPGSLSVTSYELLLWSDGAVTLLHEPEEAR